MRLDANLRRAGALSVTACLLLPIGLLAGCPRSHGVRTDAGIGRDGGRDGGALAPDSGAPAPDSGCFGELVPTSASLRCPAWIGVGERLVVEATIAAPGCCGDGAALAITPDWPRYTVAPSWDLCSCCLECECLTPPALQSVDLGVVDRPGTVTVTTGTHSCEVEVRAITCDLIDEDTIVAPRVRLVGETIPVLVSTDTSHGCGCVPRAHFVDRFDRGPELALQVCDCSLVDPCVDAGYDATLIATASPIGEERTFHQRGGRAVVDVRWGDECTSVSEGGTVVVESIEHLSPAGRVSDGRGHWIAIHGYEMRCCGEPVLAVTGSDVWADRYELRECEPDACFCADPHRVDFTTHHFLGELSPGPHTIQVLGARLTIDG